MAQTRSSDGGPTFGRNIETTLFLTWLFVGGTVTVLGVLDTLALGFAVGWPLLLGGVVVTVFVLRDWVFRDGGEFRSEAIDQWFLLATAFAFAVTLWAIVGRLGLVN
ncbi:MAG: hypothetical protein ABEI99_07020 [Halobaculum sp.]